MNWSAIQEAVDAEHALHWQGTFEAYYAKVEANPAIARLSHARLYDMIREAGTEETEQGVRYNFFTAHLFGIDPAITRMMEYFAGAAARMDVRKRVLLLIGPPASGKSSTLILLKRALEAYSRTEAGALYGIVDCPLHEEPLHAIPASLRPQVEQELGVIIEGELCPRCVQRWQDPDEWNQDIRRIPVERVLFSERDRVGIGTFTPGDPKYLDTSMLVGSLDFSKIAEYGSESDPRAYRFDGEFMRANRGLMEEMEWLKQPRDYMALLLTLAQEQNIKTGRYALISADETIIAHSNLAEYETFLASRENEAMKDRVYIVTVPYALRVQDEDAIYRQLLGGDHVGSTHVAPETVPMMAWLAVLSRLAVPQDKNITVTDKLKLYNGDRIQDVTDVAVAALRKEQPQEGLTGLSPRNSMNCLAHAVGQSAVPCVTPVDYLKAAIHFVDEGRFTSLMGVDAQKQVREWITLTRQEYDKRVKQLVMKAFVHAFDDSAQTLLQNYLAHAEAILENQEIPDEITGEPRKPDEQFLREIEDHIGVNLVAARAFREELVRKAGSAARKGEPFRWNSHPRMAEGIEQQLFTHVRPLVKGTLGTKTPDEKQTEQLERVTRLLQDDEGYCRYCAQAVLRYAGNLLVREGQ